MRILGLIALSFLFSCQSEPETFFTVVSPGKSGVEFKNLVRESELFNVLKYGYFYNGGGVAVGDVNNDGLPDIYFTGNMMASHLYLNKGNMRFENVAKEAGVEAAGLWNTGVTMADVNGDGWLDIYVCRSAAAAAKRRQNLLFINNGDADGPGKTPTFTEKTVEMGLGDTGYSTQGAFFDYDRDGDLDLYLLNHSVQEFAGFSRLLENYKNQINPSFGDKLFENRDGLFFDVTMLSGIKTNVLGFGLGLAIEDLNGDGWLDIYVSNDYNEEDYYYINQQNGKFVEAVREHFDHVSLFSMGSDVGDINNDGRPDVITLDMLPEDNFRQKMTSGADNFEKKQALYAAGFHYQEMRNMLQLNNGDGSFSEIGQLSGISNTDWSWAALLADYDLDGWKDLFITNGYKSDYTNMDFMAFAADQQVKSQQTGVEIAVTDLLEKIPSIVSPNYMYKNNGDLTFAKVTAEWGLDQPALSNGAAYADLDNDGDLDLVINNVNEVAAIYRNNAEKFTNHHYLKIRLKGAGKNTFGVGARVTLRWPDRQMIQTLMPTRGYQSAVEPLLLFGLGSEQNVPLIHIRWPDGKEQILENTAADQLLTIDYQPQDDATLPVGETMPRLFGEVPAGEMLSYTQTENDYNDFKRDPLLPHMFSTQGPRLSVGDVNGDGLEDVFIGGARGQESRLFLQRPGGAFDPSPQPAFAADKNTETVESVFFDADADGDLDLYATCGGNEWPASAPELQDILYLNDGAGRFVKAAGHLPAMLTSTACVAAGDMDGDGDTDLFVGGRITPGSYPVAPRSYLLENDGEGHFTDVTEKIAPALQTPGLVCDAIWTDVDNDQRLELMLAGEWMPIAIYRSQNGLWTSVEDPTLQAATGWWNTIAAADMDGDGDTDYVLGNFGKNSQIKASAEEPVTVYAKDFDGNGSIEPILCYYIQGENAPMAPKDDLLSQLVSLKKKYVRYEDYARASIQDFFTAEELSGALQLEAACLATSYLENQGGGKFALQALPLRAQFSPVYSILTDDFNGDGARDILLAGNLLETRVQFGRYDANKGALFLGDGRGNFTPADNAQTGLLIKGAVRDLKAINTRSGAQLILVAKNQGALQVLRKLESQNQQ